MAWYLVKNLYLSNVYLTISSAQSPWWFVVKTLWSDDKYSSNPVEEGREQGVCSFLCEILLLYSDNSDFWRIQNFVIKNNVLSVFNSYTFPFSVYVRVCVVYKQVYFRTKWKFLSTPIPSLGYIPECRVHISVNNGTFGSSF
jgi:hypothetical protein